MNFATLPPETNSARMYSGPGAGSMIEAAAIWDGLAAQLHDLAADYSAVTAKLVCGWQGPTAMAITQAAAPYVAWLNATGAQAQQTATRAKAAASAYDSAFAAMVPPPVIEANRARRRSLASTNCLGRASPAIADIEADYEQMWAQDADAMYAYAHASADASALTRFSSRPSVTGPAGSARHGGTPASGGWALTAAPEVISAGHQLMSTIPEALEALSVSPLTSFDVCLSSVTASLSKLSSLSAPMDVAIGQLNSLNKAAALDNAAVLHALISGRARDAALPRGFGRGMSIGTLSVPPAWAMATAPHPVTVQPPRSGWVCEPIRLVKGSEPPMWPSCS
jgi:PPE-repeat protein